MFDTVIVFIFHFPSRTVLVFAGVVTPFFSTLSIIMTPFFLTKLSDTPETSRINEGAPTTNDLKENIMPLVVMKASDPRPLRRLTPANEGFVVPTLRIESPGCGRMTGLRFDTRGKEEKKK